MAEVGGLLQGIQAGRQQKRSFRHLRQRTDEAAKAGLEDIGGIREDFEGDPLIGGTKQFLIGELAGAPDQRIRNALFGGAAGEIARAGGEGISNPQVQEMIYRSMLEEQLQPAQEEARDQLSSEMAARGMGRSGEMVRRRLGMEDEFADRTAGVRRDIAVAGAKEAFNERLQRATAAQNLFGVGSQVASGIANQAGGFGLRQQGFQSDLAKFMADLRMRAASEPYAIYGGKQEPAQYGSQGFFNAAELFNQGLGMFLGM